MKRFHRFLIDLGALWLVHFPIAYAYGIWWGVVAMLCLAAYGCWSFWDGATR